jgi:DNA repair protein RadC
MLLASIELAKRLSYAAPTDNAESIRSPQDVADLVMNEMRYLDREHFRVLILNTKNVLLKNCLVSIGALNSSLVHPREVFKQAIKNSGAAIILVHNHPSGCCTPSQEDIAITKRLVEAGKIVGIEILDHVVIGDGTYFSFKDRSML